MPRDHGAGALNSDQFYAQGKRGGAKRPKAPGAGDGPTTIEKALVVNAIHSYHVDHVLNGKSVCLGGVCVGGVSKTSPFSSVPLSGTQTATTAAAAAAAAAASRIAPVSPTGTQAATTTSGW